MLEYERNAAVAAPEPAATTKKKIGTKRPRL